jgi:hypothetical protein
MSPLISSFGGSSEQSYRGTLDDWPVPFDANLASQNLVNQDPGTTVTASLTVTGLNYKTRITLDDSNALVSINGNSPVSALDSDPIVYVRDNDNIVISYALPLVDKADFSETYVVTVRIGKRTGTWTITTRVIDNIPDSFSFIPQIDLDLGITTTSNTVTIGGLEPNFDFNIEIGTDYFKNGNGPFSSGITTIRNGDTIGLTTTTPSTFNTAESYRVTVEPPFPGTFNTNWGIETRLAKTLVDPFSFTPVPQANRISTALIPQQYLSNLITIAGIDSGPLDPNPFLDDTAVAIAIESTSSSSAEYEVRKSDGTLRFTDPFNPGASEFWQSNVNGIDPLTDTTFAYLDDTIQVRVDSATTFSTDATVTLLVGESPTIQSGTYTVTTRPQPYNTQPDPFNFIVDPSANRAVTLESNTITLSGITTGFFASADISSFSPEISPAPEFRVVRGGAIVKNYTDPVPVLGQPVTNGDEITLRMVTPNIDNFNGVGTFNVNFHVTGENTQNLSPANVTSGNGFITQTGLLQSSTWQVTTVARSCGPITPFSVQFPAQTGVTPSIDLTSTFIASGFEPDCNMTASITPGGSTRSVFISRNGSPITETSSLSVNPNDILEVSVRSSPNFSTTVSPVITISNATNPTTPNQTENATWDITTTADTADATVTLSRVGTGDLIAGNGNITLQWTTVNCLQFYQIPPISTPWSPPTPTPLNGSFSSIPVPTAAGTYEYVIQFETNPAAGNNVSLPEIPPIGSGRKYVTGITTIVVLDDTSPEFQLVADGSSITQVPGKTANKTDPPSDVSSDFVRIVDITAQLSGQLSGDPGFAFGDGSISKILSNNNEFNLVAQTPTTFLDETAPPNSRTQASNKTTLTLSTTTAPPTIVGSIDYTVTANPCIPSTFSQKTITNPISGTVVLILNGYDLPSKYQNANGTITTTSDFLVNSNIVSQIGNYSDWAFDAFGGAARPQVTQGGLPRDITWTEIVTLCFAIYNTTTLTYASGTPSSSSGYNRNPNLIEFANFIGILSFSIFTNSTVDGTSNATIFQDFINSSNFSSTRSSLTVGNASYNGNLIGVPSTRDSQIAPGPENTGVLFGPCNEIQY